MAVSPAIMNAQVPIVTMRQDFPLSTQISPLEWMQSQMGIGEGAPLSDVNELDDKFIMGAIFPQTIQTIG